MVKIVRLVVPVMTTHWKEGNLFWKIAVRIPIYQGKLIAVTEHIGPIVRKIRVNLAALITDAVIMHLDVRRRLKICPAVISLERAAENTAKNSVKLQTSFLAIRCKRLRSSREGGGTGPPLY